MMKKNIQSSPPPSQTFEVFRLHGRHGEQVFRVGEVGGELGELGLEVRVLSVAVVGRGHGLVFWFWF